LCRKKLIQTRGIYGLRREGKNTKTFESKAAATGAKLALNVGLFKLCGFILGSFCYFINFVQKFA
jgi:hypothetical protein